MLSHLLILPWPSKTDSQQVDPLHAYYTTITHTNIDAVKQTHLHTQTDPHLCFPSINGTVSTGTRGAWSTVRLSLLSARTTFKQHNRQTSLQTKSCRAKVLHCIGFIQLTIMCTYVLQQFQ